MRVLAIAMLIALALGGCRIQGGRFVVDEVEKPCPGGRIDTERRITDQFPQGQVRTTTIRSNMCLD